MSRARLSRLTCGALAVAVGLLAVHLLWWSRPTAYAPYGSSIRGPAQVEETRLISLLLSDPTRDVTVHALRPAVTENTSDATIDFVVCTDGDRAGIGGGSGSLPNAEGPSFQPLADLDLDDVDWTDQSLVARITPRRPGGVRIEGVHVTYTDDWKHLWRTGTQRFGTDVVVRTG
ncbi:hypothetical protein [Aeromicrobium sp.]|uniref:hypothetical protein n=1 Tax=Aeromicrobium sp. TaxID=1871063 RepID=UPI0035175651